ncbi:hypothetical protein H0H10_23255 [Streptomyces sp. TRM S81-3]|uniref:Secreted protein n=1 Tax=Streptomyces griseicoloratus TaxID=2752516 RepID=A0A926QSH7_9ACTN|nr:hypothetical protein [Streptomyces griseicoloratus]MBD0422036.1 hypothetical protein [Streptomyces griseicoloratus]
MAIRAHRRLRHLAGASCAAALLAGTAGVAGAEAVPRTTPATVQSPSAAPHGTCTDYHYGEDGTLVWDPPGCTPP